MQPPNQHQRVNLTELKAQMVKKLGTERAKQYFFYLNRFLSLKLSKAEFNKLCIQIVGRENIPLHNHFIHSILKNACGAKFPPLSRDNELLKPVGADGNKEAPSDGPNQSTPNKSILSDGNILQLSPRKVRTGTRDRKALDRLSALGPNGKIVSNQSSTEQDDNSNVVFENGDLVPRDIWKQVQHHQGLKEQGKNGGAVSHQVSTNFSVRDKLQDNKVFVHSKDPIETVASENRIEVSARSLLCAPLGVPSCPASVVGARKLIPLTSSSKCSSLFDSGGLLGTSTLRDRMEQIAVTRGLEGVSMDSANLLNNGVNAYMKGLISSCIDLVGARSGDGPTKSRTYKHQAHLKLFNGVSPNHQHIRSSTKPMEGMQGRRPHSIVSLLDIKAAMELNPQQLGEDWPLLLEKICTRAFEE